MNYSTFSSVQDLQVILLAVSFISILLFVFMIYVGICVIKIKDDVRELTDLEFKKYKESKNESLTSEKIDVEEKNQKPGLSVAENTDNNKTI